MRTVAAAAMLCAAIVAGSAPAVSDAGASRTGSRTGAAGSGVDSARDSSRAASAPLSQRVGQLIVSGFPGTSVPSWMTRRLARRELAGVVLFGYNVRSPSQVRVLDAEVQRAARGRALVALDQEGGQVRRFPWASPLRDGSAQTTTGIAYRSARAAARDLRAVGANLNFAPVADVALGRSSEMRRRAFPGGAADVSRLLRASLRGYRRTGVAATAKHFPGFGAARANTDDAVVRINRTRAQLERTELAPFRAAIAARAPLVMAAHALYPAYDRRNIASQSRPILQTLLRKRLGFKGVVVTDSMEARAVLARSSVQAAAERSVRAGADLLLLSGAGSYLPVYNRLLARARSDSRFRARVTQAYNRVMTLKASLTG